MPNTIHTKHSFSLNTGAQIPAIGCGTWHVNGNDAIEQVKNALRAGYRHIDTAFEYGNEAEVGQAIRDSAVPREEIWLTTKLHHTWHHRVPEAIDASLKNLGVDYVDLYLMHWPCATDPDDPSKTLENWDFIKTWEEMQKLPATGKVRSIGICNTQLRNLNRLLSHPSCKTIPAVNQIEMHPNYPSSGLLKRCHDRGIHVTAYSVLGSEHSPFLAGKDEKMNKIAEEKGKTMAQILLKWGIYRGTSVLPRSTNIDHIKSNFDLDGWSLSDEEMAVVDHLRERIKAIDDDFLPTRVFFDDEEKDEEA